MLSVVEKLVGVSGCNRGKRWSVSPSFSNSGVADGLDGAERLLHICYYGYPSHFEEVRAWRGGIEKRLW